jgi:endonuclease III
MKKPLKKTGRIWRKTACARSRVAKEVCERLRVAYGLPRLGNPKDPLDDLVYIVVSNKTSPPMARLTYRRLKASFDSWDGALGAGGKVLRSILKPAGLSRVKASQLQAAFKKIRTDFGECDLRPLRKKSEPEIHRYLVGLPGVSDKVAKCVMMYTMGAPVLPVDGHVHRIATRLGWTARKRADQCHEELEALVPPSSRYVFHVGCVLHGREVCRPENPACELCCINAYCEYLRNKNGKG